MNAAKQVKNDNMNPKKRGLGRGLGALFDDEEADMGGEDTGGGPQTLGLEKLEPGSYQPRQHFDDEALNELAASIRVHGILEPILVRPKSGFSGIYEIVAGERRWRAAQLAQLHDVPVIIREMDDKTCLEIALIENLQREDLNPIEEGRAYKNLMEEFGHTQEKLAAIVGKSRSHIANTVRLMTLPSAVTDYIKLGKLSAGHARALITAKNPEELAKLIVNQGLSVRDTEKLVAGEADRPAKAAQQKPSKDVDTIALEEEITNALGMNVSIDVKGHGGTLKISFKTLDQLDEVLHRLSHFPGRQQTG